MANSGKKARAHDTQPKSRASAAASKIGGTSMIRKNLHIRVRQRSKSSLAMDSRQVSRLMPKLNTARSTAGRRCERAALCWGSSSIARAEMRETSLSCNGENLGRRIFQLHEISGGTLRFCCVKSSKSFLNVTLLAACSRHENVCPTASPSVAPKGFNCSYACRTFRAGPDSGMTGSSVILNPNALDVREILASFSVSKTFARASAQADSRRHVHA